jgi:hypothetical protein
MTISNSINRPKLNTTLSTSVGVAAALTEVSGSWVIDFYTSVTLDAGGTSNQTIFRQIVTPTISGTVLIMNTVTYAFPGSAPAYSAGGVTPALSLGTASTSNVDLNTFLIAAGNANKNS